MHAVNFTHYGSVDALNDAFGDRWIYVGRGNRRLGLKHSVVANRYSHKAHANAIQTDTRDKAVEMFRRWLWQEIQAGNEQVLQVLRDIDEDTVLVCWCKPKACHTDVLIAAAKWLQEQES